MNVIPGVSYRKHFKEGLFFRVGLNVVFNNFGAVPWANISIGKNFNSIFPRLF